jgi:hypothetical protein
MAGSDHLLPAGRARAGYGKRVQQCEPEKNHGIIEASVSVLNLASKGLSGIRAYPSARLHSLDLGPDYASWRASTTLAP